MWPRCRAPFYVIFILFLKGINKNIKFIFNENFIFKKLSN
jgi:hypothetical protein